MAEGTPPPSGDRQPSKSVLRILDNLGKFPAGDIILMEDLIVAAQLMICGREEEVDPVKVKYLKDFPEIFKEIRAVLDEAPQFHGGAETKRVTALMNLSASSLRKKEIVFQAEPVAP